jgi:hypothetical protein
MVKKFLLIIMLFSYSLFANEFIENCTSCHNLRQLQMFHKKYLLKYSSQAKIKQAMIEYIKNPSQEKSVMPFGFIRRFGVKPKLDFNQKALNKTIDIYLNTFDIKKIIE